MLEVQNLVKTFDGERQKRRSRKQTSGNGEPPRVFAVNDVSFSVGSGEIHALLGENGAGKSTLLKILSGAQAPDQGTIEFGGEAVTLASPHAAQRLGIPDIRMFWENDLRVLRQL